MRNNKSVINVLSIVIVASIMLAANFVSPTFAQNKASNDDGNNDGSVSDGNNDGSLVMEALLMVMILETLSMSKSLIAMATILLAGDLKVLGTDNFFMPMV